MSDSMDKAVWQAAKDGKEAELRRLIERGGSVNWHNPQVRRRMCLAWAPAPSRPLLLRFRHRGMARHGAVSPHQPRCTARLGVGFAAAPPTRGAWHTPPRRTGRAARPRAPNMSSRLTFSILPRSSTEIRSNSFDYRRILRQRRVCPTPPRVQCERQRHECKPRACPSPKHMCHGPAAPY